MTNNSSRFSIFGIHVERKTDILAGVAFLLALGSAVVQISFAIAGARTQLFPPDSVVLTFWDYGNDSHYLRIGAPMSYVNKGRIGYNSVVTFEAVEFSLGNSLRRQVWGGEYDLQPEGSNLTAERKGASAPFPVNGGSAVSHFVLFASAPTNCSDEDSSCGRFMNYLNKSEFLNHISQSTELVFTFYSHILGVRQEEMVRCTVSINQAFFDNLIFNSWISVPCEEGPIF